MDNQSPGLNFSLGNFLGAPDLDIVTVDVIAGASTAFYGPSAFNGVISMQTKDPFQFTGLSASLKAGERNLTEFSMRWAAKVNEKFAYKINVFALKADDWEANNMDPTDISRDDATNPGGYEEETEDDPSGQFSLGDHRSLDEVIRDVASMGYIPSFCTACYRVNRTGEHFMEFSVPGFIKRYCSANAILTLAEYIMDYAKESTATKGWKVIDKQLEELKDQKNLDEIKIRIERIKKGERDLYF